MNFLQIETAVKSRLARILEKIPERRSHCVSTETESDNSSTQFLQMQKNHIIDLQEHFERYFITLPVFEFNSERNDINFIKSYLLLFIVNDRDVEPIVIKKKPISLFSSNLIMFNSLIFLCFFGGATNLDSYLKAKKL